MIDSLETGGSDGVPVGVEVGDSVQPAPPLRSPAAARAEPDPGRLRALRRFHFGLAAADPAAADAPVSADASTAGEATVRLVPAWLPELGDGSGDGTTENRAALSATAAEPGADELLLSLRELVDAVAASRTLARERFRGEVAALATGLRAMLVRDRRSQDGGGEDLTHALGGLGDRFLDPKALAERVRSHGREAMPAGRRERIGRALELLEVAAADVAAPVPTVICEPALAQLLDLGEGNGSPAVDFELVLRDQPLDALGHRFDQLARETAEILAAMRVARLELEGSYDPELHDLALARFDWQYFQRQELSLLPGLIALVSWETAAGSAMSALSQLLLSGRPVHILVPANPLAHVFSGDGGSRSATRLELGYLGLSHRGAFVHQGSTGALERLRSGYQRAVAASAAALHVVAAPRSESPRRGSPRLDPERLAGAALSGRAHPIFVFDPATTGDWEGHLDLSGNPDACSDWPGIEHPVERDGAPSTLALTFTFADLALLSGRFASEFWPLEAGIGPEAVTPLPDWLALVPEQAERVVPFVWAKDDGGQLTRLAVSRRLALACGDRLDFWHTLQHLAGIHDALAAAGRADAAAEPQPAAAHSDPKTVDPKTVDPETVGPETDAQGTLAAQRRQVAAEVVNRLMKHLLSGAPGGS